MDLLQRVANLFQVREKKRNDDYASLVDAVASGCIVDEISIASQLEAFTKTPDELAADVAWKQERIQDAATLADRPRLEAELADVWREVEQENRRWVDLEKEHGKMICPLNDRVHRLKKAIFDAGQIVNKLQRTYRGPLTDELRQVEAEHARTRSIYAAAEKVFNEAGAFLQKAKENRTEAIHLGPLAGEQKRVEAIQLGRLATEHEQAEQTMQACRETVERLEAREREIRRLQLEP